MLDFDADCARVEKLFQELDYLEAKAAGGEVFELVHDFQDAISVLPDQRPKRRVLKLLEEALRRDLHFIARHAEDYPQALFQCLYNSCQWSDAGDGATAIVEAWRPAKEPDPGFVWVRALRPPERVLGTGLVAVLRGHHASVKCTKWSPDGSKLASGGLDHTVRVWDGTTGQELYVVQVEPPGTKVGWVESLAWSPDGRMLATASVEKIRLWDVHTGIAITEVAGFHYGLEGLAWSPNGRLLAWTTGPHDGCIRVWDVTAREYRLLIDDVSWCRHEVSWSPSGTEIVVGVVGSLRIIDIASGRDRLRLKPSRSNVYHVAWSPDGRRIASGCADGVHLWDAASGELLRKFTGHDLLLGCGVAWSPCARLLAWVENSMLHVWDSELDVERAAFRHVTTINDIAWSPAGLLASAGNDGEIRIWSGAAVIDRKTRLAKDPPVNEILWSPDGARLATAQRSEIDLWQPPDPFPVASVGHGGSKIRGCAWSPQSTHLATASRDGTVRIWDAATVRELHILPHGEGVYAVCWSSSGEFLCSVDREETVSLWESATGRLLARRQGSGAASSDAEMTVAWRADDECIAISSGGCRLMLLAVPSLKEQMVLEFARAITSVAWSPDGSWLMVVAGDVTAWQVLPGSNTQQQRQPARVLKVRGHCKGVRWAGKQLITWSEEVALGRVYQFSQLWDIGSGCCVKVIDGVTDVQENGSSDQECMIIASGAEAVVVGTDGVPRCWLNQSLFDLAMRPGSLGRTWAGRNGSRLELYEVLGDLHLASVVPASNAHPRLLCPEAVSHSEISTQRDINRRRASLPPKTAPEESIKLEEPPSVADRLAAAEQCLSELHGAARVASWRPIRDIELGIGGTRSLTMGGKVVVARQKTADQPAEDFEERLLLWLKSQVAVDPVSYTGQPGYQYWKFNYHGREVELMVVGQRKNTSVSLGPDIVWLLRVEEDEPVEFVPMLEENFSRVMRHRRKLGRGRVRVHLKSTELAPDSGLARWLAMTASECR